MFYRYTQTVHV